MSGTRVCSLKLDTIFFSYRINSHLDIPFYRYSAWSYNTRHMDISIKSIDIGRKANSSALGSEILFGTLRIIKVSIISMANKKD